MLKNLYLQKHDYGGSLCSLYSDYPLSSAHRTYGGGVYFEISKFPDFVIYFAFCPQRYREEAWTLVLLLYFCLMTSVFIGVWLNKKA